MLRNREEAFWEVATAWSRGRDHWVTPNSLWVSRQTEQQ